MELVTLTIQARNQTGMHTSMRLKISSILGMNRVMNRGRLLVPSANVVMNVRRKPS